MIAGSTALTIRRQERLAVVGNDQAPFAEQTIIHGGKQSMPLSYDNTGASLSEAQLALDQDWTASGIKSLSLYFRGAAGNKGQLYVKINNVKVLYDGAAGDIAAARVAALEHRSVQSRHNPGQGQVLDGRSRRGRGRGHPVHRRYPAVPQGSGVHRAGAAEPGRPGGPLRLRWESQGFGGLPSRHGLWRRQGCEPIPSTGKCWRWTATATEWTSRTARTSILRPLP